MCGGRRNQPQPQIRGGRRNQPQIHGGWRNFALAADGRISHSWRNFAFAADGGISHRSAADGGISRVRRTVESVTDPRRLAEIISAPEMPHLYSVPQLGASCWAKANYHPLRQHSKDSVTPTLVKAPNGKHMIEHIQETLVQIQIAANQTFSHQTTGISAFVSSHLFQKRLATPHL